MTTKNMNTTENTPLGSAEDSQEDSPVNWDAATKFFGPMKLGQETPDTDPQDGDEDIEAAPEGEAANDAPSPQDELVEVRVKGRVLMLPRADAEAIEQFRRETRERDGRLGGELATTRERLARLEGMLEKQQPSRDEPEPQGPTPPDHNLALTDFAEWQRQWDAYQRAEMTRVQQELVNRYEQERARERQETAAASRNREWADHFYRSNPHLNRPAIRPLVSQVYAENQRELDGYGDDIAGAFSRLAELTDARVSEIASYGKTGTKQKVPQLESSSAPAPAPAEPEPRKRFSTAAWMAKERERMKGN